MSKRLDHVEAAKAEALRLGAVMTIDKINHHVHGVIAINGQQRKIFISKTPSDSRVLQNIREDVRRKVKEMMK